MATLKYLLHMDTLEKILVYGLSIRQIPLKVSQTNDFMHFQEGDEVFEQKYESGKVRKLCRRWREPKNAGFWMAKAVRDTGSIVLWDTKRDNLSPTLEKSVNKAIGQINEEREILSKSQTILTTI